MCWKKGNWSHAQDSQDTAPSLTLVASAQWFVHLAVQTCQNARLTVLGQMFHAASNTSQAKRSKFQDFALEFLATVRMTEREECVNLIA